MKRGIIFLLMILPLVSAIELSLTKESYQPEETFQAQLTGNFLLLNSDNILIYKNGKSHPEPVIKGLTKQNNIYYFYAILPNNEGNYTIRIENSQYFERGKIKSETIEKNFSSIYKNSSDLSFNPGFVVPMKNFTISVKSLYKNKNIKAIFEATGETKDIFLLEGVKETLKFILPTLPSQKSKITFDGYEIPIFLIKKTDKQLEQTNLEFIPSELSGTIVENKDYSFIIVTKNIGNKNLTYIKFSSDLNTKIIPEKIELLEPNSLKIINLTISISKIKDEKFSGKIIAETQNKTFELPIFFNITKNQSEVNVSDAIKIEPKNIFSCTEIGELCTENKVCNGETIESLDGPCCIGECIEEKRDYNSIIGIILIIALILIVSYIILKIWKRKKIKSPDEILDEKTERFRKRMRPGEEVRGRLDSV